VVAVMMVVLSIIPSFHLSAQDYRAQAVRILRTVPLIDGHNDLADAIRERGGVDSVDLAVSQPKLMTDIARLRSGHVAGQFWAAYVPVTTMEGSRSSTRMSGQIDLIRRFCAKNAQLA
jgi:membrane dipeptidase